MRKKYPSIVRVLLVLAMVVALTGVLLVAPVSAAPAAGIAPANGPVGQSVTVNATGYAFSSILTATFDGAAAITAPAVVQTSVTGDVTFALKIPTATAGPHAITVTDGVNSVTQTFTVEPKVTITPLTGPTGTSVTVTGTGFAAGFTVNCTIDNTADVTDTPVVFASAVTDSAGGFTATGAVPSTLPAGASTVTAADLAGNNANANAASFKVTPSLIISPTNGLAGSTVSITGTGWAAGTVTLTFAGGAWTTVTASGTGVISATAATPSTAIPGVSQVTGTDTAVPANTAVTSFTVNARPLTVSPSSGPMGTTVLIQASNLTSGPAGNVPAGQVTIAGVAWSTAVINIGTAGAMFPTTLVVPAALTVGANTVRATDNMGLVAQGTFTVTKPTVAVNPTTGPIGSSATVTGSGWVPNKAVTLNFAGAAMTVVSDANGNIAAAMSVPATAVVGANLVTANDGTLGNTATAATFTVPGAALTISPTEGSPGEAVTLTGTGFPGYTAIQVTFANFPISAMVLTSPLGTFSLATTVPGVAPGAAVVAAVLPGTVPQTLATTYYVVKQSAETVETALAGIMDVLDIIWDYSGGDWLFYDPNDTAGSDLDSLDAGTGYWVKVSEAVDLIYGGHSYSLIAGWNNIGWLGA